MTMMHVAEHAQAGASYDGLEVDLTAFRKAFARDRPGPLTPFGPCGASLRLHASSGVCNGSVIVTQAEHDGAEWIHASIARKNMPSYADLACLKLAVFGPARYAFQVFPAADRHISIHDHALHLWGRADGTNPAAGFWRSRNDLGRTPDDHDHRPRR